MQLKSLKFFHSCFSNEEMNFLFTGDFSDDLTDRLIDINNQQLKVGDEISKTQRKAAFLIAESFQNIVRHSDLSNQDSYFHIKNDKGLFSLISGNTIHKNRIPSIQGQLEQLNKLTAEELKEIYRKTLVAGEFSEKGGAGLGFIEMARKTKNKLSFSFSDINRIKSYFFFQLLLNATDITEQEVEDNFDNNIFLREVMIQEDLFLVYKGVISTPITVAILAIIENSFETTSQKVIFIKLMGFIEKISALSSSILEDISTMLFIGETESEFSMGNTCLLANKQANKIQELLNLYKTFSKSKLDKEYNRLLQLGELNPSNENNLSTIELVRYCSRIEFDVQPYSSEFSHVTLIIGFKIKKRKTRVPALRLPNIEIKAHELLN